MTFFGHCSSIGREILNENDMLEVLLIVQSVISVLLVVAILMQNKGEGLGVIAGDFGSSYHTKRGFEKFLVRSTVMLAVLFLGVALVTVAISA